MTGLIWKDFLMMRKTLKTYLLFFVVYSGMSIMGIFPMRIAMSMITVVIAVLPISAFSYDDMAKWDQYAVSMPLGRRKIVCARYLFVLLLGLVSLVFGIVLTTMNALMLRGDVMENLLTMLILITYSLILNAIILPIIYKVGPEHARMYLYLIVFAPMIFVFLAAKLDFVNFSRLTTLPAKVVLRMGMLSPVAGLAGLGLSYLYSCHIYERKEF